MRPLRRLKRTLRVGMRKVQHVLHAGYEGTVAIRRDLPIFAQVRMHFVFS